MSEVMLYLAGRTLDPEAEEPRRWEFLGIFSDQARAEGACSGPGDFVAPVMLNQPAPEKSGPFPSAWYPRAS